MIGGGVRSCLLRILQVPLHTHVGGIGEFRAEHEERSRIIGVCRDVRPLRHAFDATGIDDRQSLAAGAEVMGGHQNRDARRVADALWALARSNRWTREAEAAEAYLDHDRRGDAPINRAAMELVVAWHGEAIGELTHDGVEWRWRPMASRQPPLIRSTRPGSLPPFIESLLPEGWLARILDDRDERETLRTGRRYMSNITIVDRSVDLASIPRDVLRGRLAHFQNEGTFTGRYGGPTRRSLEETFQENLARMFGSADTPRLSGVQIKAPMCLQSNGDLVPATNEPFTHILKPAGTNGFDDLPIVEWICLTLARAAAFEVPEVAIVLMPDGMAPALLVERFDIRRSENDTRRFALEDFCSVLELPATRKYDGTLERMARGLRPLSSDPVADIEILFRRAVFAWLIADGDMHLKNLALLKVAERESDRFAEVRMAPVYDAVTTILFPGLEHDRMAPKLDGKDDRLGPENFLALARTIDLPQARASELMADCARRVADAAPHVFLPFDAVPNAEKIRDRVRDVVLRRADPFL